MEMKQEYTILHYATCAELIQGVNRLIGEGWYPIGGVCATTIDNKMFNEGVFAQAMVFDE